MTEEIIEQSWVGDTYLDSVMEIRGCVATFIENLPTYHLLTDAENAFWLQNQIYTPSYHEVRNLVLDKDNPIYIREQAEKLLQVFSQASFDRVETILPKYKYENALQVTNETTLYPKYRLAEATEIKNHRERVEFECRNEYYRLKELLEATSTIEEIDAIERAHKFLDVV